MKINRRGFVTLGEIVLVVFVVVSGIVLIFGVNERVKAEKTQKPITLIEQQKAAISFTIEERVLILGSYYEIVRYNPTGVRYIVNNHTFTQLTNPDGSPFIGNK